MSLLSDLKKTFSVELLTITAYSDDQFSSSVGEFKVQFNPKNISRNKKIVLDDKQPEGASGGAPKYKYTEPEKISMEIEFSDEFDFSKINPLATPTPSIDERIDELKELIFDYNGDIHMPNFVQLNWNDFSFQGRTTGFQVSYSKYNSSGNPLRAKISLDFIEYIDDDTRASLENRSSPDLTHYIEIKEGDSLPVLCQRIYNNPNYYMHIAEINSLNSFRELTPGQRLIFPPLAK